MNNNIRTITLAKIPATTSSATIPRPPDSRWSIVLIGKGFKISRILNRINPRTAVVRVNGNPMKVTTIPAISSITIQPGSLRFNVLAAAPEIQMANKMKINAATIAADN